MQTTPPSPLQTLVSLVKGYLPKLFQARGWVLCGLALLPVAIALAGGALAQRVEGMDPREGLRVFHTALVSLILPIMVLVAAPGGIREDLEQRTLPLFLARPAPAWALPAGRGLLWFLWGALWLCASACGLLTLGVDPAQVPFLALALVMAFWAELAFMNLLLLLFKRGTLWGAVVLFGWENLVRVLPGSLQRFTFQHHIESISGSRGGDVATWSILAQEQIASPLWLSLLCLAGFGLLCWGLCGWRLWSLPVGLAGAEAEG